MTFATINWNFPVSSCILYADDLAIIYSADNLYGTLATLVSGKIEAYTLHLLQYFLKCCLFYLAISLLLILLLFYLNYWDFFCEFLIILFVLKYT